MAEVWTCPSILLPFPFFFTQLSTTFWFTFPLLTSNSAPSQSEMYVWQINNKKEDKRRTNVLMKYRARVNSIKGFQTMLQSYGTIVYPSFSPRYISLAMRFCTNCNARCEGTGINPYIQKICAQYYSKKTLIKIDRNYVEQG